MIIYQGRVKDNVVVLPDGARLPDGTAVEVRVAEPQPRGASAEEAPLDDPARRFEERLLEAGLISEIKPRGSRSPVTERRLIRVEGKPLSEIVIEDRR